MRTFLSILLALAAAAFSQDLADLANIQEPSPKLSPAQVIKIQLAAFQKNDTPSADAGIRKAFQFASPANRAVTGPIDRFLALVKNPLYRPLLNHRRAEFSPISIDGDRAEQRVRLIAANGDAAVFLFALAKQKDAPYSGCWMTEGVARIPERATGAIRASLATAREISRDPPLALVE